MLPQRPQNKMKSHKLADQRWCNTILKGISRPNWGNSRISLTSRGELLTNTSPVRIQLSGARALLCLGTHTTNKPTIIDQDYTCDGVQAAENDYYELLWPSQQCGKNATRFHKILSPTTTDIKVRICRDQMRGDEDLAIKTLELYIK